MIETPNIPLNVQVNKVLQLPAPYMLSMTWEVPDNSEKFDLEHFKVHIMLPEQDSYIANGTSMKPEYRFHSDMIPSQTDSIHIHVTAVSKCSQQGLRSVTHRNVSDWRENPDITAGIVTCVSGTVSKPEKAVGEDKMISGKLVHTVTLYPLHISSVYCS